jgi:hypothetical protein
VVVVFAEATCPVIWLRAKATYLLPREILVRRFVTIIGHPLALPSIDAHTIIRAFMVEAGGYLDCRFVVMKRGRPVEVIPELLYELKGSAVYVRLGGEGTGAVVRASLRRAGNKKGGGRFSRLWACLI